MKWGFLRETKQSAKKAGIDKETGLHRTGLEEYLKIIIEFDGIQHYTNPWQIRKDEENTKLYEAKEYTVVRIPYFIQLSRKAIKTLFAVDMSEELFDETISSLGLESGSPASLCPAGIKRMAKEFKKFPEQYEANKEYLKKQNDTFLSGVDFLEKEYNRIK